MRRERAEGEAVHDGGDSLWHGVDGELEAEGDHCGSYAPERWLR